jgi:hypothetical protein
VHDSVLSGTNIDMKNLTAPALLIPVFYSTLILSSVNSSVAQPGLANKAQILAQSLQYADEQLLPKPRMGDAILLSPESLIPTIASPLDLRQSQPSQQLNFSYGEGEPSLDLNLIRFNPNDPSSKLPGSFTTDPLPAVPILFDSGDRSNK